METGERRRRLDTLLAAFAHLWRPQPFRQARPAWCEDFPALTAELLALPEAEAEHLASDGAAALARLCRHLPVVAELAELVDIPVADRPPAAPPGRHWAWEIPGRKRSQIEAFAGAARASGRPVLDWCGGKGHLGRLLALEWQVEATSLEIDPLLCADGRKLAGRARADQKFVVADALATGELPRAGQHLVALHACGDLHRRAVRHGAERGVAALDLAPCCYYRGVAADYAPLAGGATLRLARDDLRLAVTETVTASPRLARQRDRAMAWKLGFDALRREVEGSGYRPFKPPPAPWLRADFAGFCRAMMAREGLPLPPSFAPEEFERRGWQRQREVLRLSVVRHAFRRGLEVWLVADLAAHLEAAGYAVGLTTFCRRELTPRNLMLSARR